MPLTLKTKNGATIRPPEGLETMKNQLNLNT